MKWVGVLLVAGASAGYGFALGADLRQRIMQLKYLKKMILMLRGEIKFSKAPLPEAFYHIGKRAKEPFSTFFGKVSERLMERDGTGFIDIWESCIHEQLKETKLKKEDKDQLLRVGDNLGYLDGEMQLSTIDLYLEQMEMEIMAAEKTVQAKTKVYQCLGIMGGLFVAVISL